MDKSLLYAILGIGTIFALVYYKTHSGLSRAELIDWLNTNTKPVGWARLTTDELKQVYPVLKLELSHIDAPDVDKQVVQLILNKYNIKFS